MPEDSTGSNELPVREICDLHQGEWLLIKILDADAPAGDARGQLLAHGPDRVAMFKAARKARKQDPTALLTIVGGGTKFGDGAALRESLARIAAEGICAGRNEELPLHSSP